MLDKAEVTRRVNGHRIESTLRGVDLNLLTVFDAVMQEQNITRAAHNLGMSQPAVSNAVARLKSMFNDELFMRHGRGIQPTPRARQLFGPIRQALQLVRNELPGATFLPESSERQFNISVCNPCDARVAPDILKMVSEKAPHVQVTLDAEYVNDIKEKLRYQEIDFAISYACFEDSGFASKEVFTDELVVVASRTHPRIGDTITEEELHGERHAAQSEAQGVQNFSAQAYCNIDCDIAYKGASLGNVLHVVGQSELITLAPRWVVDMMPNRDWLKVLAHPSSDNKIKAYLNWHESSERDKGHIWMRDQLLTVCGNTFAENTPELTA